MKKWEETKLLKERTQQPKIVWSEEKKWNEENVSKATHELDWNEAKRAFKCISQFWWTRLDSIRHHSCIIFITRLHIYTRDIWKYVIIICNYVIESVSLHVLAEGTTVSECICSQVNLSICIEEIPSICYCSLCIRVCWFYHQHFATEIWYLRLSCSTHQPTRRSFQISLSGDPPGELTNRLHIL